MWGDVVANSEVYQTAIGKNLRVRAYDKEGKPLAKDVVLDLPELREFLTKTYAAHQQLANTS